MSELVQVISSGEDEIGWTPVLGSETLALLDRLELREEDKKNIRDEAISVLSKCLRPTADAGHKTGLVIGYIQSGKTMSFTTLAALAHDNGYKLIVVITGITKNLFEQSRARLEQDLEIRHRRTWKFHANPKTKPHVVQSINVALQSDQHLVDVGKQTVLIAAMKNSIHLKNLIQLLNQLDLRGIPTLVIDDEADQASLNTQVRDGGRSTIYQRILDIRDCLPHHTFLQYTATPQALLLINLIDVLSPDFAEILTPGSTYTGGKIFFERNFDLVRRIRLDEVPTKKNLLFEPPESLLEAMQIFYLGVASGVLQGESTSGNRSMMVHPSKETMQHANYTEWVRAIQKNWSDILDLDTSDLDYLELIESFQTAYLDLTRTVPDLPHFSALVPYLQLALKTTLITEVNAAAGKTPQIEWHQDYAHILVGGEVLNRGYTIEGLTVTYMPRGRGVGNADTIQQRARWFGYKANYLGYCRVFLTDTTRNAYESYVQHEEDVRCHLANHKAEGNSLREWRRAFLLSGDMKPTRDSVLDEPYMRVNFSNSWFSPRAPHLSSDAVISNREIISQYLPRHDFGPDVGHPKRTKPQIHLLATGLPLEEVYEELLTRLHWANHNDSQLFAVLLLQLGSFLSRTPNEKCDIYLMSSGELRERGLDENGNIKQLFQGPQYFQNGEEYYPGDGHIYSRDHITVQVHNLRLRDVDGRMSNDIPAIAVRVPHRLSGDWLVQEKDPES